MSDDGFLVLVPTMWNFPLFEEYVSDLLDHRLVSRLVIIDNAPEKNKATNLPLGHEKLIYRTFGYNIGVNPAWNLAGKIADRENIKWICLLNDDLIFDLRLFKKVLKLYETDRNLGALGLHPGQSIVNDSLVFIERQNKFTNGRIDFIPYTDSQQNFFGFGCLMLFRRETFIEVPAELKIYFGDDWIFHTHVARGYTNYFISNMLHYTPYAATTGTLTNHVSIHDAELVHFEKHMGDFLRGL